MAEKNTLAEAHELRGRRLAKKQFGNARAADMAAIDEAMISQEQLKGKAWDSKKQQYVDIEPKQESGPGSVLPSASGAPPALPGATPDYDTKAPPPPPESARERAIRKAQEDLLGKEEAEKLRREQRKQEERKRTLIGIAEGLANSGRESGGRLASRLAALPTPGSLWFPLVLLILFFFILITYNEHTRLQWLWLVLTGNASFNLGGQGQTTEQPRTPTGGPGAGAFGTQPSTPVSSSLSPNGTPMTQIGY